MAIAIRTSSSIANDGGVTSYTITAPAGIVAGDFLLFIAEADTDTAQTALVGPSSASWTSTGGWYAASTTGGGTNIKTWYKWADGTDAGKSWTVTVSSGSANFSAIVAFTGVDTTTPLAATPTGAGSNTLGTTATAPAITPTVANAFAVVIFGQKGATTPAVTWTPPSTTTELIDLASGSTNYITAEVVYKQLTSAANVSTGTFVATMSASKKWTGATVALNPAAAPDLGLVKNIGTNTSTSTTATSLAVTVPSTGVGKNNLITVRFAGWGYANATDQLNVTISDSKGNTYYADYSNVGSAVGINKVYSCINAAGLVTGDTITVGFPAGDNNYAMIVEEFTGVTYTTTSDGSWRVLDGSGTSGTGTTPSSTLAPPSTVPAKTLVCGTLFIPAASTDVYTEDTDTVGGDSWHTEAAAFSATGTQQQAVRGAYKVPTDTTQAQTWNPTLGTSRAWLLQQAIYRGSADRAATTMPKSGLMPVFM